MKKLLLILCFFSIPSNAGWFDKKLASYNCPSDTDAIDCSAKCTKDKNPSYEHQFSIDINRNLVLIKDYENGTPKGSRILEQCKIFDEKNWDCTYTSEYSASSIYSSNRMAHGIYSSIYNLYRRKDDKLTRSSASCAK
jgi:hypothetical protein